MNENQPHNDHRLHIEPCPCGYLHPEVMGDDFDADVHCPKCTRITPPCGGTKDAINWWNKNNKSFKIEFLNGDKLDDYNI